MTIDNVMLGAVRQYLMGMASVARMIHSDIAETGRSLDYVTSKDGRTLGGDIASAKQSFLRDCKEMLKEPVPTQYSHTEGYQLNPSDKMFLSELLNKAENANWEKPKEVDVLIMYLEEYAPHGGFGSNQ